MLLVLTLLITPAASAQKLSVRPLVATLLAVAIALACTMGGILLGLFTPYPTSFFVATLSFAVYLLSRALGPLLAGRERALAPPSR